MGVPTIRTNSGLDQRDKPMNILDRFRQNIKIKNGCWEWQRRLDRDGYGFISFGNVNWRAHRLSHQLFNSEIPKGLNVLHRCDNPRCVNPKHLFIGTQQENMKDKERKGRAPKGPDHWLSKLDSVKVREIRGLIESGVYQKDIASKYGIAQITVSKIHRGITWSHVS